MLLVFLVVLLGGSALGEHFYVDQAAGDTLEQAVHRARATPRLAAGHTIELSAGVHTLGAPLVLTHTATPGHASCHARAPC